MQIGNDYYALLQEEQRKKIKCIDRFHSKDFILI